MKPPSATPADAPAIPPLIEPLAALLELVASERPQLLPWLLSVLPHSPAGYMLGQLAREWEVLPWEIQRCAEAAALELDRLELGGPAEPYRLPVSDLAALFYFALERHERVAGDRRLGRLKTLTRQLRNALKVARRRQRMRGTAAAAEPEPPTVDRRWLEEFIGR